MTEEEFNRKLKQFPELRARFESLLEIVENADGDTTLANEAERRVIEELRGMGQDALQGWANRQVDKTATEFVSSNPKTRKHEKKN